MPRRKTAAGTADDGTEAEIVLPDVEPTPPELGDVIDGTEDDIDDFEPDDAEFDGDDEPADDDPADDESDDDDAEIAQADDNDDDDEFDEEASDVGSVPTPPAVAAAVQAVRAAKNQKVPPMAKTAAKKTKAEMIRDEIAKRQARGEDPIRPRDIVAAFAAKGVAVAAPQVSVALQKATGGKKPTKAATAAADTPDESRERKRVANKPNGAGTGTRPASAAAAGDGAPNYADLEAVSDFVLAHGGVERVRSLLSVVERLEKRFRD